MTAGALEHQYFAVRSSQFTIRDPDIDQQELVLKHADSFYCKEVHADGTAYKIIDGDGQQWRDERFMWTPQLGTFRLICLVVNGANGWGFRFLEGAVLTYRGEDNKATRACNCDQGWLIWP